MINQLETFETNDIKELQEIFNNLKIKPRSRGRGYSTFIDLTGMAFGKWQVIKYDNHSKWICKCECGNTQNVLGRLLRTEQNPKCSNCKQLEIIKLIGKKFGKWLVLSQAYQKKRKGAVYTCKCDCGTVANIKKETLVGGYTNSCRKCSHKTRKFSLNEKFGLLTIIAENPIKMNDGKYKWECQCACGEKFFRCGSALSKGKAKGCLNCVKKSKKHLLSRIWHLLTHGAKIRNLNVEVTIDDLLILLEKQNYKCALTGMDIIVVNEQRDGVVLNSQTTASVDRIDSSKGYILGNVQWVHKDVNIMKMHFVQNYFIDMCRKIAKKADAI